MNSPAAAFSRLQRSPAEQQTNAPVALPVTSVNQVAVTSPVDGGTVAVVGDTPTAVLLSDGGGTLTLDNSTVTAGQTGLTLAFTYTADSQGLSGGAVRLDIPAGWSAPSTTGTDRGYTTASTGTVTVSGQSILVSGVSLAAGGSLTIRYGDRSGRGPGVISGTAAGTVVFSASAKSTATGTLSPLAAAPTVTVYPDGVGTLTLPATNLPVSKSGQTLVFTYTADALGMSYGTVSIEVPPDWTLPTTSTATTAGRVIASTGVVSTSDRTILVSGITLAAGGTMTITYGYKLSGYAGVTTGPTPGNAVFQVRQSSFAGGTLKPLAVSPFATLFRDGEGTMTLPLTHLDAGLSGVALPFRYTAGPMGMSGGALTLFIPPGWSAPSTLPTDPGYISASAGVVSLSGNMVTVSGVTLAGGEAMTITYGDRSGGGPGPLSATTCGPSVFAAQQKSTAGGSYRALARSPGLQVCGDGLGTLTLPMSRVSAGQGGLVLNLTYTADAIGMQNGAVSVSVPAGWTAPDVASGSSGHAVASKGTVSVSGQTITVSGLTLAGGEGLTITYGEYQGFGEDGSVIAGTTSGKVSFDAQSKSTATGTMTPLVNSPAVWVYPDGTGSIYSSVQQVSAGQKNVTLPFNLIPSSEMVDGTVTIDMPPGWSPPSTVQTDAGYTSSSHGFVSVSGQTIVVSGMTRPGGQSVSIMYGDTRYGSTGATVGSVLGNTTLQTKQASLSTGTLTALPYQPAVTVFADGAGTLTLPATAVKPGQTAVSLSFTYTADAVGLNGGAVSIAVPDGWSAPSLSAADPGYTTVTAGAATVSGQTILVSGLYLSGGQSFSITYGDRSGGGPGATGGSVPGNATFVAREQYAATSTLTALAAAPAVTVYTDGAGTLTLPATNLPVSKTGQTLVFTYRADAAGMSNGAVSLEVPPDWTLPTTSTATTAGRVIASAGVVTASDRTILVSGITLAAGGTMTITYGYKPAGYAGATTGPTPGPAVFRARQSTLAGGTLQPLAVSPSATLYRDGEGTVALPLTHLDAGASGVTLPFRYTAGPMGMSGGVLTVFVPPGWSAPSMVPTAPGYVSASAGTVSLSGNMVTVSGVTLAGGEAMTITYGDRSAGGPGALGPTTCGPAVFSVQQKSTATGFYRPLAPAPGLQVCSDGLGTLTLPTSRVSAGRGLVLSFTYTADAMGMQNGALSVTVPAGWTPPDLSGPGYIYAAKGTVSVSGQTFTVSDLTLAGGEALSISYGMLQGRGGTGGVVPGITSGSVSFDTQSRATASGTMTALVNSPTVWVYPDGTGSIFSPAQPVSAGQVNVTVPFTFMPTSNDMVDGIVTITVPAGWSPPSTVQTDPGYTTSSHGTVSVNGQTIVVSGVTRGGGQSISIIYGDSRYGGTGATAGSVTGNATFLTKQASLVTGFLTALPNQPAVTVFADGAGTLTLPDTAVKPGQSAVSLTFTYTADAAGLNGGAVSMTVPDGWSAPSMTVSAPGYTTATAGTVSVSGQTVLVSGLYLSGGQSFTITYGDRSAGGAGATAAAVKGNAAFAAREQYGATGTLTALAAAPIVLVFDLVPGTISLPATTVAGGQTGLTLAFTYRARFAEAAGRMISVTVPAGWSAPATTAGSPGYANASAGTVSVSGQTITVTGMPLAAGESVTITYGDRSGGGPGATSSTTPGSSVFATEARAEAGAIPVPLAASPAVTIYAPDGSGSIALTAGVITPGKSGLMLQFVYTAAAGGLNNGAVTITVPAGWSSPELNPLAAGYTIVNRGTLSVSGQTMTVSGLTLAAGEALVINYGERISGGPGVTAGTVPGTATFQTKSKSLATSSLSPLATSPTVWIRPPDGSGTITLPVNTVPMMKFDLTLPMTYTAGTGGMKDGMLVIVAPEDWSLPSTVPTAAGYVTVSTGSLTASSHSIIIQQITLGAGETLTVTYGDKSGGGPGVFTGGVNGVTRTFGVTQMSAADGALTPLASVPGVMVVGGDGAGTVTANLTTAAAAQSGLTMGLTYTAATGGMSDGAITVAVPGGWSPPSLSTTSAGYVKSSKGTVAVTGQLVTISALTLAAGETLSISYGDRSGGGPGATATSTPGTSTFSVRQKATAGSSLADLASSPAVTLYAADGSGILTLTNHEVAAGKTGLTLPFTYTAATGGMYLGILTISLPAGWSAPSTSATAPGFVSSDRGSVSVSGQTITVSGVTLPAGGTMTVTYGDKSWGGTGAVAPTATATSALNAAQKSLASSTLLSLAASPSLTVYAADGSGTLSGTNEFSAGATGRSLTFSYQVAAGGMKNGAVSLTVPAGWGTPSTSPTAAGYTTATAGTVSVSGQSILVQGLTLSGGTQVTISYGSRAGGGPGLTVPATAGSASFTAQSRTLAGGTLAPLASSPVATVYGADGSGTLTSAVTAVTAGQSLVSFPLTFTAGPGGTKNGILQVNMFAGWCMPSTQPSDPCYVTASKGTLTVSGQTVTISGLSLAAGESFFITVGDRSAGGPGIGVPNTSGTFSFNAYLAATSGGSPVVLATLPSVVVTHYGTLSSDPIYVPAGRDRLTFTFTYTAGTFDLANGSIVMDTPDTWSPPSLNPMDPGYVTSSQGTVSITGSSDSYITVSGVNLSAGQSFTFKYGDTSGGGPGVTVAPTINHYTVPLTSNVYLTPTAPEQSINFPPVIDVISGGTLTMPITTVVEWQTGLTLPFTYTAVQGGLSNGSVSMIVPSGWSAPSTVPSSAGYTTASKGTVSVSGQTITVSGLTMAGGQTLTIIYGDRSGGGPGAAAAAGGITASFTATVKPIASSYERYVPWVYVRVVAADGTGNVGLRTATEVTAGQTGITVPLTYYGPTGGTSDGAVTIEIPAGWSAPGLTPTAPGYTTSSRGQISVSGQTITISGLTLNASERFDITYGDKSGGGPGATAGAAAGSIAFMSRQKSTAGGTLTQIPGASVKVYQSNGAGTVTITPSVVSAGQTGLTLPIAYTVTEGGMRQGTVTVTVPTGWSPPSTTATAAGYTTSDQGSVSVSGQTITVTNLTLGAGQAAVVNVRYGDRIGGGPGATAGSTPGQASFAVSSASLPGAPVTLVATAPFVTVCAADGSGTLTAPAITAGAGQTGQTVPFTYTAASGGMSNGAVTITVPAGWAAPVTTGTAAGYVTSSAGTVTVSGQQITVSGVTLAAGGTMTVTYGDRAAGGPGATAGTTVGAATFAAQQKATAGGALKALAASPALTVVSADGSGTVAANVSVVSQGQSGLTIAFTYTAATGGMSGGALSVTLPAGWTAPSTTVTATGAVTANKGTVSTSGQTVTVSNLTLAAGDTVVVTYGDKSGGGPGATAGSTTGAATFTVRTRSTAGGGLTAVAASPVVTVYGADGGGTMSVTPNTVAMSQTGLTMSFTYAAPGGGTNNGTVTLTVPAGWSAPSTIATSPGYTKATQGTVSVSGQTVTVSGITLAAANTVVITYGDKSGGGPGAQVGSTTGAQTVSAQQKATAGGVLKALATSPVVTVYDADGSGTLSLSVNAVSAGQTGLTLPFTYTAGAGGMLNGAITVTTPTGWSVPNTVATDPGYTKSSKGTVTVSGATLTVTGLTLAPNESITITYGDRSGGGPGATACGTPGNFLFPGQSKSLSGGTLRSLAAALGVAVYGADGSGTLGVPVIQFALARTGLTLPFTYTAGTGGMNNGTVVITVPAGWTAPGTAAAGAGYTSSTHGTVSVSGQTITVSGVTLGAGSSMTVTYGDRSGGGSGATVGGPSGVLWLTAQQKATSGGVLKALAGSLMLTVYSADGSGMAVLSAGSVSQRQPGLTLTMTFTAAPGGMNGGTVTMTVPAGWSAPGTLAGDPGYTRSSLGTVTVSGQTITVSPVTLNGGESVTVTYGDKSGGGPGATVGSTTGAVSFPVQMRSLMGGILTNVTPAPSVTVYAADGSGTLTVPATTVAAGQAGLTVPFTYMAATGGMSNGAVTITVPAGWTAPATTGTAAGYVTSTAGTVTVSGQQITVSGVTLAEGGSMTVTYGDRAAGGPGATAGAVVGTATFTAQQKATGGGILNAMAASPSVAVVSADGSGTVTANVSAVSLGQSGLTIAFTYTAATGGTSGGALSLTVPAGWTAPSVTATAAGAVTANKGTVSISGQMITVSNLTLAAGETATVTYGDTGGGGPGATASSTTGAAVFTARTRSTAGGTLTAIGTSPAVTVYGADGGGTMSATPNTAAMSQTGLTMSFTYAAPGGGTNNGTVTLTVPVGWSAPSTTATSPGYTKATQGTVSVSGQTVTVSGITLAVANTVVITYGDKSGGGPGAMVGATAGAQTVSAQQKATAGGLLKPLATSPVVTVYDADGSGTMNLSVSAVSAGQTGLTLPFTYTAGVSGILNGAITITTPTGWSVPNTVATDSGYTKSSKGTVTVSGATLTVSGLTLAPNESMTITYGDKTGGGPGAMAGSTAGAATFAAQSKSLAGGTLKSLAAQPGLPVYGADGSGTLTVPATQVALAQTGVTLPFTYTAGTGGMNNGTVTITVPAGWTAPGTAAAGAGYTSSTQGTVSVSGQTITVSGVTLGAGSSMTVTYGDRSGGGSGVTVGGASGAQAFTAQQKATGGGVLKALASSPAVTVYSADGSGTAALSAGTVSQSQPGLTLTMTYTAAAGGMSGGTVTMTVPAGWSAPNTVGTYAGYTKASQGTVTVSGQTITISPVTLTGGASMTITYGDKSGGGPGATAGSTLGAAGFPVQMRSLSGGTLANVTPAPSLTVCAADGSGTLTTATAAVSAGQAGLTVPFTYTAATGGMDNGTVTITVPAGWTAPATTGTAAGYVTSTAGTVTVSGQQITVSGVTLTAGGTMTVTYGEKSGGGTGVTAGTTGGTASFAAQQKATGSGVLKAIAESPFLTVYGIDGGGSATVSVAAVTQGQTAVTLTFTYTVPAGGMNNGALALTIPQGWSAPSTAGTDAGFIKPSAGSVTVSGQTATVSGITLAAWQTLTVGYGDRSLSGPGATVGTVAGPTAFDLKQKSTAGGLLKSLATQPTVSVYPPDGSGSMAASPDAVSAGKTGLTVTFTYTPLAGGTNNGAVTLTVPSGWSLPSTVSTAAGYIKASKGSATVSGQVITVSGLTLSSNETLTITYGDRTGGGTGATAGSTVGVATFAVQAKTLVTGTLRSLTAAPAVTVVGQDGAGTVSLPATPVAMGQAGLVLPFTYTAGTGGMQNGAVAITMPGGWSAPSTAPGDAGFTAASSGTVSVSGQTVTVSGVTLTAGQTLTVRYGDTSGGGPGAVAGSATGVQTFATQQKAAAGGTLKAVATSPTLSVYGADGGGELSLPTGSSPVIPGQTGLTLPFTYKAGPGGMKDGVITVTIPDEWTAPSLTATAAGYVTASAGTVAVDGQVIRISGLTLAANATVTITFGSKSGGGPGVTAGATSGTATFAAKVQAVATSALARVEKVPSITVLSADGSGRLTLPGIIAAAGQPGYALPFKYTAVAGGIMGGAVSITVPDGWSAPSLSGTAPGYTTTTAGTLSLNGQTILVTGLTLAEDETVVITYGDRGQCGPGVTTPPAPADVVFTANAKSSASGTMKPLADSPLVKVQSPLIIITTPGPDDTIAGTLTLTAETNFAAGDVVAYVTLDNGTNVTITAPNTATDPYHVALNWQLPNTTAGKGIIHLMLTDWSGVVRSANVSVTFDPAATYPTTALNDPGVTPEDPGASGDPLAYSTVPGFATQGPVLVQPKPTCCDPQDTSTPGSPAADWMLAMAAALAAWETIRRRYSSASFSMPAPTGEPPESDGIRVTTLATPPTGWVKVRDVVPGSLIKWDDSRPAGHKLLVDSKEVAYELIDSTSWVNPDTLPVIRVDYMLGSNTGSWNNCLIPEAKQADGLWVAPPKYLNVLKAHRDYVWIKDYADKQKATVTYDNNTRLVSVNGVVVKNQVNADGAVFASPSDIEDAIRNGAPDYSYLKTIVPGSFIDWNPSTQVLKIHGQQVAYTWDGKKLKIDPSVLPYVLVSYRLSGASGDRWNGHSIPGAWNPGDGWVASQKVMDLLLSGTVVPVQDVLGSNVNTWNGCAIGGLKEADGWYFAPNDVLVVMKGGKVPVEKVLGTNTARYNDCNIPGATLCSDGRYYAPSDVLNAMKNGLVTVESRLGYNSNLGNGYAIPNAAQYGGKWFAAIADLDLLKANPTYVWIKAYADAKGFGQYVGFNTSTQLATVYGVPVSPQKNSGWYAYAAPSAIEDARAQGNPGHSNLLPYVPEEAISWDYTAPEDQKLKIAGQLVGYTVVNGQIVLSGSVDSLPVVKVSYKLNVNDSKYNGYAIPNARQYGTTWVAAPNVLNAYLDHPGAVWIRDYAIKCWGVNPDDIGFNNTERKATIYGFTIPNQWNYDPYAFALPGDIAWAVQMGRPDMSFLKTLVPESLIAWNPYALESDRLKIDGKVVSYWREGFTLKVNANDCPVVRVSYILGVNSDTYNGTPIPGARNVGGVWVAAPGVLNALKSGNVPVSGSTITVGGRTYQIPGAFQVTGSGWFAPSDVMSAFNDGLVPVEAELGSDGWYCAGYPIPGAKHTSADKWFAPQAVLTTLKDTANGQLIWVRAWADANNLGDAVGYDTTSGMSTLFQYPISGQKHVINWTFATEQQLKDAVAAGSKLHPFMTELYKKVPANLVQWDASLPEGKRLRILDETIPYTINAQYQVTVTGIDNLPVMVSSILPGAVGDHFNGVQIPRCVQGSDGNWYAYPDILRTICPPDGIDSRKKGMVWIRDYLLSKGVDPRDITYDDATQLASVRLIPINNQLRCRDSFNFALSGDIDTAVAQGVSLTELENDMRTVFFDRYGFTMDATRGLTLGHYPADQVQAAKLRMDYAERLAIAMNAMGTVWKQAVTEVHNEALQRAITLLDATPVSQWPWSNLTPMLHDGVWASGPDTAVLMPAAQQLAGRLAAAEKPLCDALYAKVQALLTNPTAAGALDAAKAAYADWKAFTDKATAATAGTPIPYKPDEILDQSVKDKFLEQQKAHMKQYLEGDPGHTATQAAIDWMISTFGLTQDAQIQTELDQRALRVESRYKYLVQEVMDYLGVHPETSDLGERLYYYQQSHGLPATCMVNDATLTALLADYERSVYSTSNAANRAIYAEAQSAVNDCFLGANLREDGVPDYRLQDYLRQYQQQSHLWDSGELTSRTLTLLKQSQALKKTFGTLGSFLQTGQRDPVGSSYISKLNDGLNRWLRSQIGYNDFSGLPAPGTFTDVTRRALEAYQEAHGLVVTGKADMWLYSAIVQGTPVTGPETFNFPGDGTPVGIHREFPDWGEVATRIHHYDANIEQAVAAANQSLAGTGVTIDSDLIRAIIAVESEGIEDAFDNKRDYGLMQINIYDWNTGAPLYDEAEMKRIQEDPAYNIKKGVDILVGKLRAFNCSDQRAAIQAYNFGEGNVQDLMDEATTLTHDYRNWMNLRGLTVGNNRYYEDVLYAYGLTKGKTYVNDPVCRANVTYRTGSLTSADAYDWTTGEYTTTDFKITIPFGNPLPDELMSKITDPFGARDLAGHANHTGIDYADGRDKIVAGLTPVYAVADGVVGFAANGKGTSAAGYGNVIYIRHDIGGDETLGSIYGHLSGYFVRAGDVVQKGDLIGYVGYSGDVVPPGVPGTHLHFELRKGYSSGPGGGTMSVDPQDLFNQLKP